jgi:hypothetical protein
MRPPDPAKRELRRNSSEPVNSFHFTGNRQQIRSQRLGQGLGRTMADIAAAIAATVRYCGLVQAYGVTQ